MKILFQSDDYGITEAVTCGILKGIREGLIRNTGLFVNMPSSKFAAEQIKSYPDCCLGIDINLVAGKPVSPVERIPNLVRSDGTFYSSGEIRVKSKLSDSHTMVEEMEQDPYPYEEVLVEVENQVKKFFELTGEKPGYIHPHSLMTPNTNRAIAFMGEKYGIPYSMSVYKKHGFHWVTNNWNPKPFPVELQIQTDVEANVLEIIPEILEHELSLLICHAGFVDEDIFRCSTYTMIRAKDLFMACSPRIRDFIESHNIELITYKDLD